MAMTCLSVTHRHAACSTVASRCVRRPSRHTVRPVAVVSKADLIAEVAQRTELKKKDVESVLASVLDVIAEKVASQQKVTLKGFGNFEYRKRAARAGRNPQTGAALQIEAKTVPAFVAAKKFKDDVQEASKSWPAETTSE
jgi:DNA-binding protein HU-beta